MVPDEMNTEPFEIFNSSSSNVTLRKEFKIMNACDPEVSGGIDRYVQRLNKEHFEESIGMEFKSSLSFVAYDSENILGNRGQTPFLVNLIQDESCD